MACCPVLCVLRVKSHELPRVVDKVTGAGTSVGEKLEGVEVAEELEAWVEVVAAGFG